jgi:hypothetical protein
MAQKPPAKTKPKKTAKVKAHVKSKEAALAAAAAKQAASASTKPHGYRSFRLQKRVTVAVDHKKLVGSFRLLWRSLAILRRHWKLFLGIIAVYTVLNWALVRGFNISGNFNTIKSGLGDMSSWSSSASLFAYLLGTGGSSDGASAGSYQFILVTLVSLALIWALRQVFGGHMPRIRDTFYRGMGPLVPFILVGLVVLLQLLPLAIGLGLYGMVTGGGVAVAVVERLLWALLTIALALMSLYLITSSIFALYIATLPDMTPMKALRSARDLVRNRRLEVLRRILFLPFALLLIMIVLVMPFILVAPVVALWLFFLLSSVSIAVIHSYMYSLYRELV